MAFESEEEENKFISFKKIFEDLMIKYDYEGVLIIFDNLGGFRVTGNSCVVCTKESLEILIEENNIEHAEVNIKSKFSIN